jgi:hypothetical protein
MLRLAADSGGQPRHAGPRFFGPSKSLRLRPRDACRGLLRDPEGAALLSVSEQIDTRTAASLLVLKVLGVVSQWESEAIGEHLGRDARSHTHVGVDTFKQAFHPSRASVKRAPAHRERG